MNKIIKFALVAVAALGLCVVDVDAAGMSFEPQALLTNGSSASLNGLSNSVPAFTTNTTQNLVIATDDYNTIALQSRVQLGGAGTSTISFPFVGSVDGTSFSTATVGTWTITPAGTLTTTHYTNLNVTGFKKIKFTGISNGNNAILTNVQFGVGYKRTPYTGVTP